MKIDMKDTCQLVTLSSDGYGKKTITSIANVDCLFLQNTSNSHSSNVDINTSDAHVYLDIDNQAIIDLGYKVEGLYISIDPFESGSKLWYKINRAQVGQRKLLGNDVNNLHAFLQKVTPPNVLPIP